MSTHQIGSHKAPQSRVGPEAVEQPQGGDIVTDVKYGSDLLVKILRDVGCTFIPTNPGSSFRGLHDSIVNFAGNRQPQMLLCHHEEIAVSMAHGYSKATGKVGFVALHDLVGLMHGSMAVYNAWCDRTPLVIIGGGGPKAAAKRRRIDWMHSASSQGALVRDFVKWDAEPGDIFGAVNDLTRAISLASSSPSGPTYITLDAEIQEAEIDSDNCWVPPLSNLEAAGGLSLSNEDVSEVVEALAGAAFPVLLAGSMRHDRSATEHLVELAEATGAACLDARNSVAFPTAHPQNLTGDKEVLKEADLVVAIGVRDLGTALSDAGGRGRGWNGFLTEARVLEVSLEDLAVKGWSEYGGAPAQIVSKYLADPIVAAEQLAEGAVQEANRLPVERSDRIERRRATLAARHRELRSRQAALIDRSVPKGPFTPQRLTAEVWDALGTEWMLAVRNTRSWPEGIWQFESCADYLGDDGGGGVGYGPGALVGAALGALESGRPTVGILGDGDLLMAPGALWTACHYRIPLLLVVNDNQSFYNDEEHQEAVALDRGRPPENQWIGMRMADPATDIAALARSYGAWATGPLDDAAELRSGLGEAAAVAREGGVAVVHVRTVGS